ncbi:exocyst complex component EXO70A1-like [Typha latifolia]|uniref:exocyst complex component EXO70A1-like n=1 Tax=Typha latifolia TaxID=4733 RepID=UPI003C2D0B1F
MATATPRADGQEKVMAAAQHIVKSLATSKNAADDMIRILSGFDNRLSSISDLFSPPPPSSVDQSGDSTTAAVEVSVDSVSEAGEDREIEILGDIEIEEGIAEAEAILEDAEKVVLQWDDSSDSLIWDSSPSAAGDYLSAVDELISFSASSSSLLGRAETALQISMTRLEDEFRHLLLRGAVPLAFDDLHGSLRRLSLSSFPSDNDDSSTSIEVEHHDHLPNCEDHARISLDRISSDLIHPEVVAELAAIADRMIGAGYGQELCQVYVNVRRDALLESLAALGVDKLSIDEVQRIEWGALDVKMKKWIQALKVVVCGVLSGERRICDQIFAASNELKEECFAEATKGCVLQLLNFGDAITIVQRSSEKLFRMLGMYEALADVATELEALFVGEAKEFIMEEANGILLRLGDAIRGTITEFGNAVQGESSRKPLQGGEIHPLTRYVMNYIGLLADYSSSLNFLLCDYVTDGDCSTGGASITPLAYCVLKLITYLEVKIEEKSKLYEDGGMQYIFLMNNILYIVQKVKDSELKTFLGDNWIRKRRGQIRQYATSYLRASWTKVLSFLRDDGLGGNGSSSSASKTILKERFKNFNLAFEEIYRTQTTWKVPDPQLREELKISLSEMVIPAYRSFVGRFRGQLEGGRHSTKYIKYTPDDLENHVSDLFEGLQGLPNIPRRKLSL